MRPLLPRLTRATEPRYGRTEPLGMTTSMILLELLNDQVPLDRPVDTETSLPLLLR